MSKVSNNPIPKLAESYQTVNQIIISKCLSILN